MSITCRPSIFVIGLGFFLAARLSQADETLPNGLTNSTSIRFGETLDPTALRLLPLYSPEEKGGPTRSFESLALLLPGTRADAYGVSFLGISSPENSYFVDGIRMGDPVLSLSSLPLSTEFAENVDISIVASDPTFGRGSGGVYDMQTRRGTNAWKTSVWGNIAPGALEGARTPLPWDTTIQTQSRLALVSEFGATLSGPIIKNKLFFFAGGNFTQRRYQLDRSLYRFDWNSNGLPGSDLDTTPPTMSRLPGSDSSAFVAGQIAQWVGKLSYQYSPTTEFSLASLGSATNSGGRGTYAFDTASDGIDVTNLNGGYSALGGTNSSLTHALILRGVSSFTGGKTRIDAALGWVYGKVESAAADGSGVDDIDTPGTLANLPAVVWRKNSATTGRHTLEEFEALSPEAVALCSPNFHPSEVKLFCPVFSYHTGGPGYLSKQTSHRVQGRAVLSVHGRALGEHHVRAGIDFEVNTAASARGYSGGVYLRESFSGNNVRNDQYGYLRGPDDAVMLESVTTSGLSIMGGAFISDSWQIRKNFLAEVSLRYDGQTILADENAQSLNLPFMLSPRIGFAWNATQKGNLHIRGSYLLRYQHVPLDVALRGLANENQLTFYQRRAECDIAQPETLAGGCNAGLAARESPWPSQQYILNGGAIPVDPAVQPPAAHQFMLGADATLPWKVRLGVTIFTDDLVRALEDAATQGSVRVIGNPGTGLTAQTISATRSSSGVSLTLMRPFAQGFVGLASYTYLRVHGNYEGYFRSETGQFDPNLLSLFDTPEHNVNNTHDLPGDHRHAVKLYAGKEFVLPAGIILETGAGYTTRSGLPYYALADHPSLDYGNEVYLPLPGGRTPWLHRLVARLGVSAKLRKDLRIGASVDVFNVANNQAATKMDQVYTYDWVFPQRYPTDPLPTPNDHYGKPTAYQAPRQIRLGLRVDY